MEEPEFQAISDMAKDFIERLIVTDQEKRMSAEEALSHDWLKSPISASKSEVLKSGKLLEQWRKGTNVMVACSRFKQTLKRSS